MRVELIWHTLDANVAYLLQKNGHKCYLVDQSPSRTRYVLARQRRRRSHHHY